VKISFELLSWIESIIIVWSSQIQNMFSAIHRDQAMLNNTILDTWRCNLISKCHDFV